MRQLIDDVEEEKLKVVGIIEPGPAPLSRQRFAPENILAQRCGVYVTSFNKIGVSRFGEIACPPVALAQEGLGLSENREKYHEFKGFVRGSLGNRFLPRGLGVKMVIADLI